MVPHRRSDCVQVVIALVVTPDGLPLAYEVLAGNTADKTTLRDFLSRIEQQYGKAQRIWVMDRGVPTEAVLEEMRQSDPPVHYLVGTPKGRLSQLEKALLAKPWAEARPGVDVKLLPQEGELYVYAQSRDRVAKERAMRRRKLKKLWARQRLRIHQPTCRRTAQQALDRIHPIPRPQNQRQRASGSQERRHRPQAPRLHPHPLEVGAPAQCLPPGTPQPLHQLPPPLLLPRGGDRPQRQTEETLPLRADDDALREAQILAQRRTTSQAGYDFTTLDAIAQALRDNKAAKRMNEAKQQLFITITEENHQAA